jgi:cell division protein FtsI/penicillin-binding protein 2
MIGQQRILASPLAMAGVAATVADGRWRSPRLVAIDRH